MSRREGRPGGTKGVYFNLALINAFNNLTGQTFLLTRYDILGDEYQESYTVPSNITELARDSMNEFFKVLETSPRVKD